MAKYIKSFVTIALLMVVFAIIIFVFDVITVVVADKAGKTALVWLSIAIIVGLVILDVEADKYYARKRKKESQMFQQEVENYINSKNAIAKLAKENKERKNED